MPARHLVSLLILAFCVTGCQSYRYRILRPQNSSFVAEGKPVSLHYAPLDYRVSKDRDRLALLITNPTNERIVLLGNKSFAVDPRGESHPLHDRIVGPHSWTRMLVPPVPFTYAYPDYWAYGPGWGWGYMGSWFDPMWGPWYGPGFWGPPPMSYSEVLTVYDWAWKTGVARLHLTYETAGRTFEHDFEFLREPNKR